jgi:hypothetical protein
MLVRIAPSLFLIIAPELSVPIEATTILTRGGGDRQVRRLLSAPRLNLSRSGPEQSPPSAVQASNLTPEQLQAVWLKAARYIVENTEDVGERFAEEARRIHYDEAPERSIRGTASAEQTAALAEEGIAVMALPLPEIAKSRLQ